MACLSVLDGLTRPHAARFRAGHTIARWLARCPPEDRLHRGFELRLALVRPTHPAVQKNPFAERAGLMPHGPKLGTDEIALGGGKTLGHGGSHVCQFGLNIHKPQSGIVLGRISVQWPKSASS